MLIEAGAVVLGALLLAALIGWIWSRLRPPAVSRRTRLTRGVASVVIALMIVVPAVFRIMDARGFQLFGTIVPRVETGAPLVALTFDDGPAPGATDRVLAMLEREGVAATFFLNGNSIAQHPEEARKLVLAGHEIGNHSYSHTRLVGLPLSRARQEVEQTDEAIRHAGHSGSIHFRPPYGKKFLMLPYYLSRTGRTTIMWDVEPDSYPEVAETPEGIVEHVVERTRPGSIILLHVMFPSRRTSLEAVPGIIDSLRAEGFRFVTVSELLREQD